MSERPTTLQALQREMDQRSSPIGRRAFLGVATLGLAGIFVGRSASDTLDSSALGKVATKIGLPTGTWTYWTVTDG